VATAAGRCPTAPVWRRSTRAPCSPGAPSSVKKTSTPGHPHGGYEDDSSRPLSTACQQRYSCRQRSDGSHLETWPAVKKPGAARSDSAASAIADDALPKSGTTNLDDAACGREAHDAPRQRAKGTPVPSVALIITQRRRAAHIAQTQPPLDSPHGVGPRQSNAGGARGVSIEGGFSSKVL